MTRTLPHRKLIVPIANGSDPDVIEMDDAHQVYGDSDIHDLFPAIYTPCENPDAPQGQCAFNAVGLDPERCLYCGKRTG